MITETRPFFKEMLQIEQCYFLPDIYLISPINKGIQDMFMV